MLWMLAWPSHSDTFLMSTCGLENVHRATVAKHVRRNAFFHNGRLLFPSGADMLIEDVLESSAGHGPPAGVME